MRRLDYLDGLGITAIWLMPCQASPGRDGGYDVSNYYDVNPRYGTLGDFVEFTHGAHQRGIRVIIDLVVNHTSDQHPWFLEARSSRDAGRRDWYVWRDEPSDEPKGLAFPGTETSNWCHDEESGQW
jgi:maltose alpha-D-glucosyltransferase/alpha-amylase